MMTKKHFIATAKTVREIADLVERSRIAGMFAQQFRAENPRFDAARFLNACGVLPVSLPAPAPGSFRAA